MNGSLTTRPFVRDDYEAAIALWQQMEGIEICEGDSREEIAEYLQRNPGLSQVVEADGQIVGAALCGHDGRRGWIYHLAVAATHRRRKIGQQLLDACLNGLRAAGLKRAIILVAGDNPAGHDFWLRNGWEDIDGALAMTREL
jgi:ribosomal protein S18 acetylase RimI-like enzyme